MRSQQRQELETSAKNKNTGNKQRKHTMWAWPGRPQGWGCLSTGILGHHMIILYQCQTRSSMAYVDPDALGSCFGPITSFCLPPIPLEMECSSCATRYILQELTAKSSPWILGNVGLEHYSNIGAVAMETLGDWMCFALWDRHEPLGAKGEML